MISYLSKYIAGIYRQSKIEINQEFQALDLRATEGDILMFLHDNPNLSQKKIATLMVLDPSLVGRDLQRLIAEKYVQRHPSTTDNRVKLIALTPSGEEKVRQLRQLITQWWTKLFADTPLANQEDTLRQLEKLYGTIVQRNS